MKVLFALQTLFLLAFSVETSAGDAITPHWRHPVAMAAAFNRIFVANQKAGSVSVLDANSLKVLAEVPVGKRLSDLKAMEAGRRLLVVDEAAHELIVLTPSKSTVKVDQRISIAKSPVRIAIDSRTSSVAVASLWSWRVTVLDGNEAAEFELKTRHVIDLPFAPRSLIWLKDRLVVGDAFGGRLAVIDPNAGRVVAVKNYPGHNIRSLAESGNGGDLLIAQQVLDPNSKTTHTPVFWGNLMQNVIRAQDLKELLSPDAAPANTGDLFRTEPLGHPSNATGDPHDVLVLPGGETVVSLSGVGEIAIRRSDLKPFERFDAQARSTALLAHPDGNRVLIANTFADSISVFDLKKWNITRHVSLGPTTELDAEERGEQLFYNAKLSLDGWYSCHSCHTDGHTTGHLNDNLSDDSYGAPKRILPLGGVAKTGPWAWNGAAGHLSDQIRSSILNTMQGDEPSEKIVADLEAYVRTIPPPPSLDAMRGTLDADAAKRGRKVFHDQGCAACHQPPAYTTPATYDVGLKDSLGQTKFNPPPLKGASQRQEFFHDSRARSLEDVLKKYQHGDGHRLSDEKRKELIAFLRSL